MNRARLKKFIIAKAKAQAANAKQVYKDTVLAATCGALADQTIKKLSVLQPSFDYADYDMTGIAGMVSGCGHGDRRGCTKASLSAISTVDPIGLTAIAASVIQEVCDVPVYNTYS